MHGNSVGVQQLYGYNYCTPTLIDIALAGYIALHETQALPGPRMVMAYLHPPSANRGAVNMLSWIM